MELPHTLFAVYLGLVMLGVGKATTTEWPTYSPKNAPGAAAHCITCPPGHRVSKHCTELLTRSECQPCDDYSFSSEPNGKMTCTECFPRDCPKQSTEEQACTNLTDRRCLCNDGYHRPPLDPIDPHVKCLPHAICKPGQGEVHAGNHSHDRKCETCEVGKTFRFVDATQPERPVCRACSACDDGSHVTLACSLHNDTQCGHDNATVTSDVVTSSPPDDSDSDHTEQRSMQKKEHGFIGPVVWIVFGLGVGALLVLATFHCRKNSKGVPDLV